MTTAEVIATDEILLNGTRFPTTGPPRRVLVSLKAPRISIGSEQTNEDSRASQATITSAVGGMGRERGMDSTNIDQCWWSTCDINFDRHLTLPRLSTQTAVINSALTGDVGIIHGWSENDTLYCTYDVTVYSYNMTTDVWTSVHTLPAVATDVIEFRISGTMYLIIATGTGYSYTTDGTTWEDRTTDVKYMTLWQDTLYAVDNTGLLKFATDLTAAGTGTWTTDAQLYAPDGYAADLLTGPDVADNEVIYLTAKNGLWQHDDSNTRFRRSRFTVPFHTNFGNGSIMWRDSLYMPAGTGVYKYFVGDQATVDIMGPDQRHGLPSDKRGTIRQLLDTHNFLIAIMDATSAPSTTWTMQAGRKSNWGGHRGSVIRSDIGYSPILAYNEIGWSTKWMASVAGRSVTAAHVSSVGGNYRMYWAVDGRVWYQNLSVDLINPDQISDYTYAASADHTTSWLDAGDIINSKVALSLAVHTAGCSSTETVKVYVGYDLDDSWTLLETITSNGVTEHTFLDASSDPAGKEWIQIRFKFELARGTTTTLTPDVTFTQFRWQQNLEPKWGDQVTVQMDAEYKGSSPKELADALYAAVESKPLVQYQDRPDTADQRWVNVENAAGWESTGRKYTGQMTINVMEP